MHKIVYICNQDLLKIGEFMWLDKRYHSLDYELKKIFDTKVIKLSVDGGFTCPTRDGTKGYGGCIFCSHTGSGEFSGDRALPIKTQMQNQIVLLREKWKDAKYIAYFQNFSNTYSDINTLKKKYDEALSFDNVVGLAIATRADCLNKDVIKLLDSYNKKTFLWLEIGLQSIHKHSESFIRRGYGLEVFDKAISDLNFFNIKTVVHLILNLPNETKNHNIETLNYLVKKQIWGIKLHMLHILKNTDLAKYYENFPFDIMDADAYISLICDLISIIPKEIVIHRLTGDGAKEDLLTPLWSKNKRYILNGINKELAKRNLTQGDKFLIS